MDLTNWNYIAAIITGGISLIGTVFYAGFYFNKKIKEACAEEINGVNNMLDALVKRVNKLEEDTITVSRYEHDLEDIKDSIREMHNDVKVSIQNLTTRIDSFIARN